MSPRRPWGSIIERDGRLFIAYTPHKGSSRRVWEPVYPQTRTRAAEMLAQRRHELTAGTWDDPARVVSFDSLAREWFGTMKGTWKAQTTSLQRTRLERHILPALGEMPARAIDGPALQRFSNDLAARLAPRTVRVIVSSVRQILRWGHRHHRLRSLPDLQVAAPKLIRKRIEPLTPDEIRRVLDAALDFRPVIYWSLLTGLRQGETLAARWANLDAGAGTFHVCESLQRDGTVGTTKTEDEGTVWVPPGVLQALEQQRAQIAAWSLAHANWHDHGLIFPSRRTGGHMTHTVLQRAIRVACDGAGVRRRRWHDLRHTCASLLIDQGENITTVSRQLRHSNPAITLSTYAHLMPERGASALAKLDERIGA